MNAFTVILSIACLAIIGQAQFLALRPELSSLIPADVRGLLSELTPEQKELVLKLNKDRTVGLKALLAARSLLDKYNSLPEPAQRFVNSYGRSLKQLNKENEKATLKSLLDEYEKLDKDSKEASRKLFPEVLKGLESVELRSLAGLKTSVKN